MPTKDKTHALGDLDLVHGRKVIHAGSASALKMTRSHRLKLLGSKSQRISDFWTILCAGCALISDGYANSLMTLINVVLRVQYADEYTSDVSTRVSNALPVGEIIGQITYWVSPS